MTMDPYDARCRDDQIEVCRTAVAESNLQNLGSGGVCSASEYDIYDQLCTLNFYTGGTDYCCCAHEQKALCCRFHYDHKYFRCDEAEDTISLPLSSTATISISVIVAIVSLIIIAIIAVKCYKTRRMRKKDGCVAEPTNVKIIHSEEDATTESQEPLNPDVHARSVSTSSDDHNTRTVSFSTDSRPQPSAPTIELDMDGVPSPPPYQRVESQPSDLHVLPSVHHGARHELYRSESDNYEERRYMERQPEPPPAYDDHHEHALFHPEINNTDRAEHWL